MALGFLAALPAIGGAVQAASGLAGLFGGGGGDGVRGPSPAEVQMMQNLQQSQKFQRAMMDPKSQIYQNVLAQEEALRGQDYQRTLRDLINANRRAALLGRQQVFDPERRDEAISRYVTRARQELGPMARQATMSRLGQQAQAFRTQAGQYQPLIDVQRQRGMQRRRDIGAGVGGIGALLGAVGRRFGDQQSQQMPTGWGGPLPAGARLVQGLPWLKGTRAG